MKIKMFIFALLTITILFFSLHFTNSNSFNNTILNQSSAKPVTGDSFSTDTQNTKAVNNSAADLDAGIEPILKSKIEIALETESQAEISSPTGQDSLTQTDSLSEQESQTQKDSLAESQAEIVQNDWVANLDAAQSANQIIIVSATGNTAQVTMHNKGNDGIWTEILSASAAIGRNGVGKTQEGDGKTPKGIYGFSFAFGIQADPGAALSYTQVDDSYYWVDDSDSAYYNQFVSTKTVTPDWNSAEHITGAGSSYNYVLAVNYNASCTPKAGSAIFMHCTPSGGAGCIAIPESSMIQVLQNIKPDCVLIIDNSDQINNY